MVVTSQTSVERTRLEITSRICSSMIIQVHPYPEALFPVYHGSLETSLLTFKTLKPCILLFLVPFNLAEVILLGDNRSFRGFCSGSRSARFRCCLGTVVSTVTFGILFVILLTWCCRRIFLVGCLFRFFLITCFFQSGCFGGSGLALFRSRGGCRNFMSLVLSPILIEENYLRQRLCRLAPLQKIRLLLRLRKRQKPRIYGVQSATGLDHYPNGGQLVKRSVQSAQCRFVINWQFNASKVVEWMREKGA